MFVVLCYVSRHLILFHQGKSIKSVWTYFIFCRYQRILTYFLMLWNWLLPLEWQICLPWKVEMDSHTINTEYWVFVLVAYKYCVSLKGGPSPHYKPYYSYPILVSNHTGDDSVMDPIKELISALMIWTLLGLDQCSALCNVPGQFCCFPKPGKCPCSFKFWEALSINTFK